MSAEAAEAALIAGFREMIAARRRRRWWLAIRWAAIVGAVFGLGFLTAVVWLGGAP
jgi:hypothetical protein